MEVTVYKNDFSTRESAQPIPSANWVVSYYAITNLALNHTAKSETMGSGNVNPWQDGWFKMHRGKAIAEAYTNLGLWHVRDDSGNAYASYSTSIGGSQTLHAHPIYNAITCGVIRTTFDIRVPKKVHRNGARLSFTLGTQNMMVESTSKADLINGSNVLQSIFEAGFNVNNYAQDSGAILPEEEGKRVLGVGWDYGRDPTSGDDGAVTGPWPTGGCWARVIVEANLDANTYDAWMISLGTTAHPTMDTPSPSGTARTGRKFYKAYNAASDGPITGIIFHNVYGGTGALGKGDHYYLEENYDDDYAFKMDNIKMEWKAPGKTDYEAFYLNDFNTCQRRTLSPTPEATKSYAQTTGAKTDSFTYADAYVMPYGDYSEGTVKKQLVGSDGSGLNTVGYDGWRRLDGSTAMYITTCGVHRVLAMVSNSRSWFVQQFGETPTSGKVKFEYDMRAPSKMYNTSGAQQGWVMGCLGSKDDWTCVENPVQYFRSGMKCGGKDDKQNQIYPAFTYKDWGDGYGKVEGNLLTSQYWYRIALTFDLDANPKMCAMTCTEIGASPIGIDDTPASGARVMDGGNRKFLNECKDLSLIVFGTYAAGSTKIDESMLVTNLKVTKNVGTENEKVIYKNDFKTRTRYLDDVPTTQLASSLHDRMFEGVDAWQRNNTGAKVVYVTGGDNSALMADGSSSLAYFAQSIGSKHLRGEFVVQADVKVPDYWSSNGGWCDVLFGNDMLKTGTNDLGAPNSKYNHPANYLFGMAFHPANSAEDRTGLFRKTRFSLMCGDSYNYGTDLTVGNWYRCVCRLYLSGDKAKTVDVALYDMGTAHPTLAMDTPATAVATATGRSIKLDNHGGVDAFALSAVGVRVRDTANYAFWRNDESGSPMVDNIRIKKIVPGMTINLR